MHAINAMVSAIIGVMLLTCVPCDVSLASEACLSLEQPSLE